MAGRIAPPPSGTADRPQEEGDQAPASPAPTPREESQADPAASESDPPPPVRLDGPDRPVFVWGKEKAPLAPAQYRVIRALVEAGKKDKRLSKDALCLGNQGQGRERGRRSRRHIRTTLLDRDADWGRTSSTWPRGSRAAVMD